LSISADAVTGRLPVFRTIVDGVVVLYPARRPIVWQILAIAVLTAATDLFDLLTGSRVSASPFYYASLAGSLILLIAYVNLTLGISRLVLFKEAPAVTDLFRWGHRQWRFLGNMLLIALGAVVPVGVGALFKASFGSFFASPMAVTAVLLLYAACWLWAGSWLGLMIPIIASDGRESAIDGAWRVSAGNRTPLLGLALCGMGASFIVHGAQLLLETKNDPQSAPLVMMTANLIITFFSMALASVFAAVSAIAYQRLTGTMQESA
jgi:hypothetical protein